MKGDHLVSGRQQTSVRLSRYDVQAARARNAGALNAPTASAALDNRDLAVAAGHTMTVSNRTVNETRAQVAWGDLQAPPEDAVGPAVSIAGVATFGTLSSNPTGRVNRLVQLVDTVSHQRGAHALRAGVDLVVNDDTITFPRAVRGAYTFASLANFLAGTYNTSGFTQTFGATSVEQSSPALGVYAQDEWKVGPAVTLNLGLRYDLQWLDTVRLDADNLAPRIGVAWTPTASRRSVVRGGAGLYFDRVPLRAVANALLSAGNTSDLAQLRQTSVSLSPAQGGAPVFPAVLAAAVPSATLVNFTTIDRALQHAYSRQASVEFEQQLGTRTTASVGYQYVRGVHLLMQINQNVPSCAPSGANNGCRPQSAYANDNRYSSAGESSFHGLLASLVTRPGAGGRVRVSYTLSKSLNNVGEAFFSSPIDPHDLSKDWGRSDDDQRHRLVVDGSWRVPGGRADWTRVAEGFELGGVLQVLFVAAAEHHLRRDHRTRHRRTAGGRRTLHRAQRRDRQRLSQRRRARGAAICRGPGSHRAVGRGLQPDQPAQRAEPQRHFRGRAVPDEPAAVVQPGDQRGGVAVAATGCARQVLSKFGTASARTRSRLATM